jgi:nitrogen fixation protein FixH
MLSDVEISRALNALSSTLREQRPDTFDTGRVEAIVMGALAHEPKVEVHATGPLSGELRIRDDGRLLATVELRDGRWVVDRKIRAGESGWAIPQPAHDEKKQ